MIHPELPVMIKRGVQVPNLLEQMIDFGFDQLRKNDTFAQKFVDKNSIDTQLTIKYRKIISNSTDRYSKVTFTTKNQTWTLPSIGNFSAVKKSINSNEPMDRSLIGLFIEATKHVEEISIKGEFIDHLLTWQTPQYLAIKMCIVAYQMLQMNQNGVDKEMYDFMVKYTNGNVLSTIRHAQRPLVSGSIKSFKIPWHRNSNMVGDDQYGFVVTALYTHRPHGIQSDSGGISFAKNGMEQRIFPASGTFVSFLDQHVIHKVIPVRLSSPIPPENRGFVQRSAVFMSWFTDNNTIQREGNPYGIFSQPSTRVYFRDLKKLYLLLHKYFSRIYLNHALVNKKTLNSFLNTSTNDKILSAYQMTNSNIFELGGSKDINKPVADFVILKITQTNSSPRSKLKDLYKVYLDLKKSFGEIGAGSTRTNKSSLFLKRGGRRDNSFFLHNLNRPLNSSLDNILGIKRKNNIIQVIKSNRKIPVFRKTITKHKMKKVIKSNRKIPVFRKTITKHKMKKKIVTRMNINRNGAVRMNII